MNYIFSIVIFSVTFWCYFARVILMLKPSAYKVYKALLFKCVQWLKAKKELEILCNT